MDIYKNELIFAKNLALEAGQIISKNFLHSTITTKSNLTPVTETDFAISRLVIDAVRKTFPKHEVVDEELQQINNQIEYQWVCDPIDGTIPFSHHIPTAMFSIALCKNGEPVVAVIYDPFIKRMLYTTSTTKTFLNKNLVQVNKDLFKPGDYIFGRPYWRPEFDVIKYLNFLRNKKIKDCMLGSIVYEGMLVALGITKAMVTVAANPWDRAAIKMIIENAGGICTDERGERLSVFGNPKYFIATNGIVHDELLDIVKNCI